MRSMVVSPFGDQPGDHEARRCAQVGGHHVGAGELRHAPDHGGVALDIDVGAEPLEFLHVHHPVLEDRLGDDGGAVRPCGERHELRLHVGGKARMRRCAHVDCGQPAVTLDADDVAIDGDIGARLAQLFQHGFERVRPRAGDGDAAAGRSRGDEEGAGLDPVRHDRMGRPVQTRDAFDRDAVGTRALDFRTHRDQAAREVHDLGLAGGVLEHRRAVGERGGHQQVLGAGDRHHVEHDSGAAQSAARADIAVLEVDHRAHRLQSLHVLVHRSQPDRTAPGQRYARLAATGQQRAKRQDRRAHRPDQFVRSERPVDARGVEADGARNAGVERDAHLAEQRNHRPHVVQARHVGQDERFGCQQRGAQDRQRGVLGARCAHFAGQRCSALDGQLIQARAPTIVQA